MNNSETYYYGASSNEHTIRALIWKPNGKPKAIVQILHGMAEHIDRYNVFADHLTRSGFIVCGNDHAGHGESINAKKTYGFFAEKDGPDHLLQDIHALRTYIQSKYPGIPFFILGHSMGSLLGRLYLTRFDMSAGFICMGTSGGNIFTTCGIYAASLTMKIKDKYTPSKFLQTLAFGNFNRKIHPQRTSNDWLSRDEKEVDKYNEDKKCGFTFTASGYSDLFKIVKAVSSEKWYKAVPDMPIFLISGTADPVGNYGKGVIKVSEKLKYPGRKHIQTILYKDARHEILHEINREQVYEDIRGWVEKILLDTKYTKQ